MSSQEEYLDQLLKGMSMTGDDMEAPVAEPDSKPNKVFVDNELSIEDVSPREPEETDMSEDLSSIMEELLKKESEPEDDSYFMSPEEIEATLSQYRDSAAEPAFAQEELTQQDIFTLLEQDGEAESQEIQELLQKDENNEVISEDLLSLLGNIPQEPMTLEDLDVMALDAAPEISEKQQKAAQKNAIRDQRNALKREKREQKRQERMARRDGKSYQKKTGKNKLSGKEKRDASSGEEEFMFQAATVESNDLFGLLEPDSMEQIQTLDESLFAEVSQESIPVMAVEEEQVDDQMAADALFQELTTDQSMMDLFSMAEDDVLVAGNVEGRAANTYNVVNQEKGPRKSIFSRFWDFLTEEDEEETDSRGNEDVSMSNENQTILKEMDAESKKKKKKKGEEPKEEGKEEEKESKKPKKEKKPKKQKPPKLLEPPGKKLSAKKVLGVAALGISACVIILVIAGVLVEYSSKREARAAYYAQDYQTCYQNLFGKDLNESEQVMFHRSEMILKIRLWIREYEILAGEGAELEALDSLIQSVHEYPALFDYSNQWNAGSDVEAVYKELVSILNGKYHLTEEQAQAIANIKSDVEYTRAVTAIVEGYSYEQWKERNAAGHTKPQQDAPAQKLPEEEELGKDIHFIDNIG